MSIALFVSEKAFFAKKVKYFKVNEVDLIIIDKFLVILHIVGLNIPEYILISKKSNGTVIEIKEIFYGDHADIDQLLWA